MDNQFLCVFQQLNKKNCMSVATLGRPLKRASDTVDFVRGDSFYFVSLAQFNQVLDCFDRSI